MKRKQEYAVFQPRKKQQVPAQRGKTQWHLQTQNSILGLYYCQIQLLGDLLHDWLPPLSRARRHRLGHFDEIFPQHRGFLKQIVIGYQRRISDDENYARKTQLFAFTQTQRANTGRSDDNRPCDIAELVDFAIWTLFQKQSSASRKPVHLLCAGYQRTALLTDQQLQSPEVHIPGIARIRQNPNVDLFKDHPWTDIADLLGRDAEGIMLALFLDCGIFQQLALGKDNLYQLSGEPLYHITTHAGGSFKKTKAEMESFIKNTAVGPASITFVRNRMFHAKPAMNREGNVRLGLKHIHALNRYPDLTDSVQHTRIMQYIFPRQFRLHNVFTSRTDSSETSQAQMDYTMREVEFATVGTVNSVKMPRRLRGPVCEMIQKLRKNHRRCSYTQLLRYYCPLSPTDGHTRWTGYIDHSVIDSIGDRMKTQTSSLTTNTFIHTSHSVNPTSSFLPYATTTPQVVAFLQAVLFHVLPHNCFGYDEDGHHNWRSIFQAVGLFVELRRFESLSLHEVCQNIRLSCIDWLRPLSVKKTDKMSISDRTKRLEILQELIYYVFDSLLIPIIRSNFYVTETGSYRNRMFYFRHDVWKKLSEPALTSLRLAMFEPLNPRQLKHRLQSNVLGWSQMRCLPKAQGVRPIMNLRRKAMKIVNGKSLLGRSINKKLEPIFSILNTQRVEQPKSLASAIFSVNEIQERLRSFKARLEFPASRYYFVKVDIRSCFDTIPQEELLTVVSELLMHKGYQIIKHVEMKKVAAMSGQADSRAMARWVSRAAATNSNEMLSLQSAAVLGACRKRLLYVGTDRETNVTISHVQRLLVDHLQNNIIRIGRKHFRQKAGIAQGSILSTLLCNFFYGDFERRELSFLDARQSLLLRLTDDFLLITTSENQAKEFVKAMTRGNIKHGISVNAEKSLVNFEVSIDGHKIPRLHGREDFPYCGVAINTSNLQLRKDRESKDGHVANGLTVARSGRVGIQMQNKVLFSLTRQWYPMFMDESLNSRAQILHSIFECFVECGMKMHRYRMSLSKSRRPSEKYQIDLCKKLIILGNGLIIRGGCKRTTGVTKSQMSWLAATALSRVLGRKQCEYRQVLKWLQVVERSCRKSMNMTVRECQALADSVMEMFADHAY